MSSLFTPQDRQLHQRVYKAFENGEDASSINSIRDEAVARQNVASTFIVAFATILQSRNISRSASHWRSFNECLEDQIIVKEKGWRKSHTEHLAFISMQWSPDVVSGYGWKPTSERTRRDQVIGLYKCAQIYPRFEDFLPQINLVWWLQYTADILNINNSTAQPDPPFRNKDLQYLLQLHESGTATICGVEINLNSAAEFGRYIRTWTESKDGRVRIPGRTIDLEALRPGFWNMHALCTDRYGLLKQRGHLQWTDKPLPAAVAQELHSYPFGDGSIEPEIVSDDHRDVEETAPDELRGGPGPAPGPDLCNLTTGASSDQATSSEPSKIFSGSVQCPPSDMGPHGTSKVSRNRIDSVGGEGFPSGHYHLRPEDCLCTICQDLRPFLDRMRSDYLRSGPADLCRLRREWLSDARWASRGDTSSSSKDRSSDLDIWYLDESSLEELVNESSVLDKPIVVTEAAQDYTAHNMESVQAVIRDNHCENEVERFLSLFSNDEQSTASWFLRGPFQVHDPKFMGHGRFTVLQRASMRAFNSLLTSSDDGNHTCKDPLHTSFLANGLSSVRVETSGAASGPHVSALGGSWFRSLVGKGLFALARTSGLRPTQGDRSDTSGRDCILSPIGTVQLILLEPDDVLILPPGIAFLHFAVDPSATLQGHFWDDKDMDRYLEATEMARQYPSLAGDLPPCVARRASKGYQSIIRGKKSKGVSRQRRIGQAGDQLSKRWRSCVSSEDSGAEVEAAISEASLASRSSSADFAVRSESDTRQETGEHGADSRCRAKRVCIR